MLNGGISDLIYNVQHNEISIINQQLCKQLQGEEYCAGKQGQIVQTSDCHPSVMHFYSFSWSAQDFFVSLRKIHVSISTNPCSNLEKSMYQIRRNCANFGLLAISNALLFFLQVSTSFLCLSAEKIGRWI